MQKGEIETLEQIAASKAQLSEE
ncbi:uncharacterized protein FFMR_01166 [Fusarium fujikuroi]|nr:uncharacterized protein FFMR_01166 [Fusarium fujikuroi]SCV31864.1 uncharacterized protein FFB14_03737 [Fusarium fujikuroi]